MSEAISLSYTLFHPVTGEMTPEFKDEVALAGTVIPQEYPEYSVDHIRNVDHALQKAWLHAAEGRSVETLTPERSVELLTREDRKKRSYMPRMQKKMDALFLCGSQSIMEKRLHSLEQAVKFGYTYNRVHFIAADATMYKMAVDIVLGGRYKYLMSACNFVLVDKTTDIFRSGCEIILNCDFLADEYAIIIDPLFVERIEAVATSVLREKTCHGVAAVSLYASWRQEMAARFPFGEDKPYKTEAEAVSALASSVLYEKAIRVHQELEIYGLLPA
jgi:hypothetical protein